LEHKQVRARVLVLAVLLVAVLGGFTWLLYDTQIIHGDAYLRQSQRKISNEETVEAARGIITDRYGRVLVGNRRTYQVDLDVSVMGTAAQCNANLLRLLTICREEGVVWTDNLPVSLEEPFVYTTETPFSYEAENEDGTRRTVLTYLGRLAEARKGWSAEDTAGELIERFRTDYGMEGLSAGEARMLAGVYYSLALLDNEIIYQYTFASDVGINFISRVKEENLPGVTIDTVTVREYQTEYAAHLLGRVGPIYAEKWEAYQAKGYNMNDTVGIDGVEYAFETYLRGIAGRRIVETNTSGKVVGETYTKVPEPGDNVALTIDIKLQEAVENALAAHVPTLDGAQKGAAVVVDVADGGILAAASYPTFRLATFSRDYNQLAADELQPMLNRAFMGTYAPGSTYKMVTATAGLEEGVITTRERILDTGVYTYYDSRPACWLYNQSRRTHGYETVSEAIRDSCNVFFYETMVRLDNQAAGIETLNEYARRFGLGEYTGLEVSEEKGILAGPEFSESMGVTWYRGNMLSAAIGQSDNKFSPLQLANYVATLVNGGSNYKAHLLSGVKSYDFSELIYSYEPEVRSTVDIAPENLAAIKNGMLMVTTEGTVAKYFKNLDVPVGAKTGSAQVAGQENSNAVFVCFAPFDEPEIAMAIVVEAGGSGSELGAIAADILAYYFSAGEAVEAVEGENELVR